LVFFIFQKVPAQSRSRPKKIKKVPAQKFKNSKIQKIKKIKTKELVV